MRLVNAKEMLRKAKEGHYAVGHFNLNNMESVRAFLLAAQETHSPIILGVSGGTAKYMGGYRTITDMVEDFMAYLDITVPVALHVDHGKYEEALDALNGGFSSVMFDGSKLPIEENLEKTRHIVELCRETVSYTHLGVLTYHDAQIPCLWVNDELEKKAGVTITGYEDLLNPALKGQVANGDPTASSSAWNQLQCVLTDFGGYDSEEAWDFIDKLMDNMVTVSYTHLDVYKRQAPSPAWIRTTSTRRRASVPSARCSTGRNAAAGKMRSTCTFPSPVCIVRTPPALRPALAPVSARTQRRA